jgi:hypothetical protein
MVNPSGTNGHYNGTRKSFTLIIPVVHMLILLPGPPDSVLGPALHDYSKKSLLLAVRLDYLLKDFGYKCVSIVYLMASLML